MASPITDTDVRRPTHHAKPLPGPAIAVLGTAFATAFVAALVSIQRARSSSDTPSRERAAWRAYLIDHLSGSDTATAVVSKVAGSHAGTPEGDVCAWLLPQLHAEREIVRSLVAGTGAGSPSSSKRIAGYASGAAAQALAGGQPGEIALFRTFESLAIGVQGKRLLWRAARERVARDDHDARTRFDRLEQAAVEQWDRLDAVRRRLVPATFGS
jgi:hypothetical protein